MYIFDYDIRLTRRHEGFFYALSLLIVQYIYLLKIRFEYFSTNLLITYIFFVVFTTYTLNNRFEFKESLCMGFLITFMNSFYWESMLHLVAFIHVGLTINSFVQLWRLIPLPFILYRWKFNDEKEVIKIIIKGLVISAIFVTFRGSISLLNKYLDYAYVDFFQYIHYWMNFPNRLICLYALIKVFYEHGEIKNG